MKLRRSKPAADFNSGGVQQAQGANCVEILLNIFSDMAIPFYTKNHFSKEIARQYTPLKTVNAQNDLSD
jgi:hypothetical protein